MIDWKSAAKYFRREMRNGIAYHRRISRAEHAKRVMLVRAMDELLPLIALSGTPHGAFCLGCSKDMDPNKNDEHRSWCPYIAALAAVNEASKGDDV